jgi:restriction endonuclease S subunit
LGNVCDVARGTTITQKQAIAGNIPVVAGGIFPTYSHSIANRPANTITISGSGANAGYVNFYDVPIFASDCSTVRPKETSSLDVHFVHYFLKSQQRYISTKLRQGAAQPHVYAKDIAKLPINFPPLRDQKRIVGILNEAFAGLATATTNAEKNFKNARELFESYLNSVFMDRLSNRPKKGFGALFAFKNGINFDRTQKGEIGTPTIDVLNMYGDNLPISLEALYRVNKDISAEHLLRQGDILVVRSSVKREGVAWAALFDGAVEPTTYCGFIIRCRALAEIDSRYVTYFLRSAATRRELVGRSTQSTITNINQANLAALLIPVVELDEQREIVSKLNRLSEETRALEFRYQKKCERFADFKQLILQKAFSGELTSPPSQAIKEAAE